MIDFEKKCMLVIDDHPGMRTSIRTTLAHFGVVKIDMASNALEAIRRIKDRHYDVLVCDYNLGEGRDGQQLLEELRHTRLIPLTTVFLMVTAERGYEKIMAAAELAPDDYLIKPFTADVLEQRLTKIVEKKSAFTPAYLAMEESRIEQAIAHCDKVRAAKPIYTIDALRLKAELLIAVGRIDDAQQLYKQVVAMRAVPWARMGLARTLFLKGELAEAEHILLELAADFPDYLASYDLLAKVQEAGQKTKEAQDTLARAVARSPNTIARQKVFGELALANGELEAAEKAFATVVEKGVYSVLRAPEDHARLARVQVDRNKLTEAGKTLKDLRVNYPNNPEAEFAATVVESLKEHRAGNPEAAQAAMEKAFSLKAEYGLQPSQALALDMARGCLQGGDLEGAKQVVAELVNNDHENSVLLARAKGLFASVGQAEEGERVVQEGVKAAVALNNEAVMLARKGDLEGAVKMLIEAATKLSNNMQILLNAAHAILTLMKQNGWDVNRGVLVAGYLDQVRKRDPDHPKYIKVNALYRDMAQKFGVLK